MSREPRRLSLLLAGAVSLVLLASPMSVMAQDAEASPEEYLRLVEAQGLKIQLRSPMAPIVKRAFDGMCDDSIIAQLEAVLAWALKQELPRGSLAGRIDEAGGIAGILSGESRPS